MKKFNGIINSIFFLMVISVFLMTLPMASFAGGLVIKGDNVGIGVTSPTKPLEVQSTTVDAITGTATSGSGVAGWATIGPGVWGDSTSNHGIFGRSHSAGNAGVYGVGTDAAGIGVIGTSDSGIGVKGISSSGYAGYFSGTVNVTGSLTAASFSGDGANLTNIGASALATGSVTSNALAGGAVTSSNIAYYSNVLIVATGVGAGDYTDPFAAMTDVAAGTSRCGAVSSTNLCLVKIMPGIYNIGTNYVQMVSYCDIEGSGQYVTTIEGNVDSLTNGVVNGQQHAEIRFIKVENTGDAGGGTNTDAVAISNNFAAAGAPMRLFKVTAMASGASGYNIGIQNMGGANPRIDMVRSVGTGGDEAIGVLNENAAPFMEHVNARGVNGTTTSYGVRNNSASPTMVNVTAIGNGGGASYGVYTDTVFPLISSSVTIRGSNITGATNSVYTDDTQGTGSVTFIGVTQLNGTTGVGPSGGSNVCAAVFDASFAFYPSTCP